MQLIWPWQDRKHGFSWLKAIVFASMFVPGIALYYWYATGQFGRLPLAGLTYWSGVWATWIVLLALAVTPAMAIFRWNRLVMVRRMIGVTALVYTIVHLLIYFALRFWDASSIAYEMVTRLSLILATVSTLGLVALGATSLDEAVRRMGAESWQRLHNTVYFFSLLAIIHYLLSPGVYSSQYTMSGIFLWLMVWRVLNRRGQGTNPWSLAVLAVAVALFTAFFEAAWTWFYQEFDALETLANNFTLILGVSPAWQTLIYGFLIALAAAIRRTPRLKPA